MNFMGIEFQASLPIAEKVRVIKRIADNVYNEETGYMPEMLEEQFWINVIGAYAQSDVFNGEDVDADTFMNALYHGGLMEKFEASVNKGQVDAIRKAVDDRLRYELSKSPADAFFTKASALLTKLEGVFDPDQISAAITAFGKLDIGKEVAQAMVTSGKYEKESEAD